MTMHKTILSVAFAALIAVPVAFAQGNNATPSAQDRLIPAPVGHRQPRAGDVPNEKNIADPNNPANKEDAALDRKLKSICRGC
jgi:hypothetical protein